MRAEDSWEAAIFYTMHIFQLLCCLHVSVPVPTSRKDTWLNMYCFFHLQVSLQWILFFSSCLCPVPLLALPSSAVGPAEDKAFEVESLPQLLAALGVSLCF